MAILVLSDYPTIRSAIDVSLQESQLPDETIRLEIHAPAADQDVIDRVSDAESKTGVEGEKVKRAAIYFCAARLIEATIQITAITTDVNDLSIRRPSFNAAKRKQELIDMAEKELEDMADPVIEDDMTFVAGVVNLDFQTKGDD